MAENAKKLLTLEIFSVALAKIKEQIESACSVVKELILDAQGKVKSSVLPVASASVFGAVKTGSGIKNTGGVISVDTASLTIDPSQVNMPDATTETAGLVKIGSGIEVSDGVISVTHPTKLSEFDNDSKFATESQVAAKAAEEANRIKSELINGAPGTMDTLKEVSDYIESHKSVETALNAAIGNKADKSTVEALSETVYTKTEGDARYLLVSDYVLATEADITAAFAEVWPAA